jgi:UDP-N-acetylglucosamine 4-epimerase
MNAIVTGCAGFIGSHLTDALLSAGYRVIGYDDLSNGSMKNLDGALGHARFIFIKRDLLNGLSVPGDTDVIFHLAALGSVPRSMKNPIATHRANTEILLHIAKECNSISSAPPRIVFASSSAVYGDSPAVLRQEALIGKPTSPYGASKQAQEIYAETLARVYGLTLVGLRYFNVFGPRQLATSAYSAVIPKWAMAMLKGGPVEIFGDPDISRDFTPVGEVVRATILAATADVPRREFTPINVGTGKVTSLGELFEHLRTLTKYEHGPVIRSGRAGDVWTSCADIREAYHRLGYMPSTDMLAALGGTIAALRAVRDSTATEKGLH